VKSGLITKHLCLFYKLVRLSYWVSKLFVVRFAVRFMLKLQFFALGSMNKRELKGYRPVFT